jgi:hypothetical protein
LSARRSPGAWWAVALPAGLVLTGLRRRRRVPCLALLSMALLLGFLCAAGCGSGRLIPGSGGGSGGSGPPVTVTPSGTYTITVNAMSAGLTRSVALTLVVR